MDQRIISLYDRFTHGGMSRREFLDRLTELAGSAAAGAALLPLLQNDYAQAAIVADNDARLATERLAYDFPKGRINGYLARAKDKGKRPVVLVIHENRGLNPHLEDVARRFALEGFLAYAVDLLSLVGGTPASEDEARALHPKMNQDDAVAALVAGRVVPQTARRVDREGRRGRLLLRRADGQPARGRERRARCRRRLLRPAGPGRRRAEDQGRADAALCRERRRRERRHRGLRGGAEGEQQAPHHPHLSGHAARLQQRPRRRALQQGRPPTSPGAARSRSSSSTSARRRARRDLRRAGYRGPELA